ncbi:hypothetical protein [Serratia liquefaciens]|uniref:hypothetical protein n=1 Tax=Serratia liquefaciens TaxID=614 RepID=UPI0021C994CB|nr:hypothetical protein [Serratia liquefaciens]
MSDSKEDGLIESVKKTLMDRINTPLFGFIFLSWVVFNWDNILFVMFSEVSIEKRINAVKVSSDFYFRGFLCPITSGFLLSVAFPYLQWSVSFLQRKAQRLLDSNSEKRELAEYAAIKSLATQRAEANNAVAFAEAAAALTAAEKNKQAAQTESDAESIREAYKTVQENVTEANDELRKVQATIETERSREKALRERVKDLEERVLKSQERVAMLGNIDDLRNGVLKSLDGIDTIISKLSKEIIDARNETNRKSISKDGVLTDEFSFDAIELLTFTGSLHDKLNEIEVSIFDIRGKLEEEIPF